MYLAPVPFLFRQFTIKYKLSVTSRLNKYKFLDATKKNEKRETQFISAYKHKVLRIAEASIHSRRSRSIFWHFYDFGEGGKTSMAFIRMNCYAYGLPFEPALEMVSTFRLGETNSFRNSSLKEIVSLFSFVSSRAPPLWCRFFEFSLCERLHPQSTH